MNIFVTGAGGFIGQRLVAHLVARGDQVLALDNHAAEPLRHANVTQLAANLANITADDIADIFNGENFSLVHLAWHPPREASYAVAAGHLGHMARLMDLVKDRTDKIISLGSADEYGTEEGCLIPEAPSQGFLSAYGWGKRSARELMKHYSTANNIACFWLRPFIVYGPGQRGNMLIPYAVRQATRRQKAKFSDGMQQRDFVHVDDVVHAIDLALRSTLQGYVAANLGCGQPMQVRGALQDIARCCDAEDLFEFGALPLRADEPFVRYADITDAAKLLGWYPRIDWKEGLQTMFPEFEADATLHVLKRSAGQ